MDDVTALGTAIATAVARYLNLGVVQEDGCIDVTDNIKYVKLYFKDHPEQATFDPDGTYSATTLDAWATIILREDVKEGTPLKGATPVLFEEHLKTRHKREIGNENGVPDPSIKAGFYWRVHPQGRKVNSEEARKRSGAAWYR